MGGALIDDELRPRDELGVAAGRAVDWRRGVTVAVNDGDRQVEGRGFGDNTIPSGQEAAAMLLARPDRPTAIFCANDEMAIGTIIVAKSMGLGVPADLSVVGFDDVEMAAFYDPPLTTIHQPRAKIGRVGVAELLALLEGRRKRSGRRITLKHELVARGSVRAIAAP